jgi:exodeoxyribonuclease V gamma subunit
MGMAKWLSAVLAKRHSICSNYRFLFPNAFIDDIFHSLCQTSPKNVLFETEIMLWRIMGIVPRLVDDDRFLPIREYLSDDSTSVKLYQLSERIASAFEQYQLYRPDMIADWDRGNVWLGDEKIVSGKDEWQPVLWKELTGEDGQRDVDGNPQLHHIFLAVSFGCGSENC